MNKELKRTVKYFNKNRGLILKTIIPVVILCALVTIIGAILPRPNDNIFPSKRDYLFVNHNPNFNVAFGKQDSPDTSYVRFEAKVGDNPFEMKERNFWDNFTEFFSSKKGFEFGLSEVRFSQTDSETSKKLINQMGSAIEQMQLDKVFTNTEVIEVGRLLGEQDEDTHSKQTVLNKDVYPGIDIEYQILEDLGVKEEIIIRDIEQYTTNCGNDTECLLPLNEFVFDLKLDEGLILKESMVTLRDKVENKYYITDEDDNYIAHFLPTFAIDNSGSKTTDVDLEITQVEGNDYKITVILNLDWLFSSDRVFPIRIDPSIVHDTTTEFDTGYDYNTEVITGPKVKLEDPEIAYVDSDVVGYWNLDESIENTNFAFETGTVTLSATIDYTSANTVTFTHDYVNPVVVAYIPTRSGGQSADVRVRNVSNTGFEIFMEEPDNESHNAESASYMVVEAGRWELSGGPTIEAGVHFTSNVHRTTTFSGDTVDFSSSFSSTPAVLATLNTYNNQAFMSTVVPSTSTTGFTVQQEAAETGITALPEEIGWIAVSTGSGTINGYAYESALTNLTSVNNGVDETPTTISFSSSFSSAPDVIVNGRTGNGANGYWARGAGTYNSSTITVYAEEDQVTDTERGHAEEAWSYVAFASGANMSSSAYTDYSGNQVFEDLSTGGNDAYSFDDLVCIEGPLSCARDFEGGSDQIRINEELIPLNADFTVDMWVNLDQVADGSDVAMLGMGKDTDHAFIFYASTDFGDATNQVRVFDDSLGQILVGNDIRGKGWTHIALVRSSDVWILYENGRKVASNTVSGSIYDNTVLRIGTYLFAYNDFEGGIDEVRISDVARSSDEIERLYRLGYEEMVQGTHTSASLNMNDSADVESITWTAVGDDTGDGETPYSTTSLVGQWDFNETFGTTADNEGSCGNSCDGTLYNMTTSGQDAAPGTGWTSDNRRWGNGALMFDGSNDYVSIPWASALRPSNDFSVEAWVNVDELVSGVPGVIINYPDNGGGDDGWGIRVQGTGRIAFYALNSNGWYDQVVESETEVKPGVWYHVVGVYDNSTLKIYVNGHLDNSKSASGDVAYAVTAALNVGRRGGTFDANSQFFDGTIDTLRFYNRVLNASEILSNYQAGNIEMRYRTSSDGSTWGDWSGTESTVESFDSDYLYDTSLTGFLSYWPMEESSGTTVEDLGYSNDGTASGAYITDGKFGNGRTFDGVNDYISIPDNSSLRLSSGLTLEMWFKTKEIPGDWIIPVRKDTESGTRYLYGFGIDNDSGGRIYGQYYNGTNFIATYTDSEIFDGNWHHAAMTISGTTLSFYFDGALKDSTTISGTQGVPTGQLNIGAAPPWTGGGRGHYFEGSIDEVRISNTVATSGEIAERWRKGSSNPNTIRTRDFYDTLEIESAGTTVDANTLGYWSMDDNIESIVSSDSNLEGYWDLRESTGTGAYLLDKSSNSNHGDPTGTTFTGGRINGGRAFNGSSDYVNIPNNSSLTFERTDSFSLEMWFKADGPISSTQSILSKMNVTDEEGYEIFIYNDDIWFMLSSTWDTNCIAVYADGVTVTDGLWHHVVASYDGSSSTSGVTMYIDGISRTLTSYRNSLSSTTIESNPVTIGSRTGGLYFDGEVDEVAIYSDELTQTDVDIRYYYGRDIKDSSSYYNHGISYNATNVKNGKVNGAMDFDGTDDWINLGNLGDPSAGTIEFWMNLDNSNGGAQYLLDGRDTGNWWFLQDYTTATCTDTEGNICFNSLVEVSSAYIHSNKWQHVAITMNSTETKAYIDGNLVATGTGLDPSFASVRVGTRYTNSSYLNGKMDELRISNVVRTEAEIAEAYAMGRGEHVTQEIDTSDISSNTMLPFWVLSDQLGNNLDVAYGESDYANYEADEDTVGLWHLEEAYSIGSSYFLEDSSGNGNHGDPDGSAYNPPYPEGVRGLARSFNGTDGVIKLGTDASLSLSSDVTLDAWIKIAADDTDTAYRSIIGNTSNSRNYNFYVNGDGSGKWRLHLSHDWEGSGYQGSLSDYILDADEWYHVAGVITTSGGGCHYYYVNGKLVYSSTNRGFTSITGNTLEKRIGSDNGGTWFDGVIDEVRISKTVRTADEIRQTYEVGRRTHPITVDFKADLESSNLISNSGDTSFTISEQDYGTADHIENLDIGEKVVVKEYINTTNYFAQGIVDGINKSTGAVTVDSWLTGSTFPSGGYTSNATLHKWQREYIDIRYPLDEDVNGITRLTFRKTTDVPAMFWIDDLQKATYSSDSDGSSFSTIDGVQYIQYEPIFTKWDPNYNLDLYLSEVEVDYSVGPTMEQLMRHGKWFNSSGVEQPFWWADGISNAPTWVLNFNTAAGTTSPVETNSQTVPENTTIYLSSQLDDGFPTYSKHQDGSYTTWNSGYTETFSADDSFSIRVSLAFGTETKGTITLRENDASGRILDTFFFCIGSSAYCGYIF